MLFFTVVHCIDAMLILIYMVSTVAQNSPVELQCTLQLSNFHLLLSPNRRLITLLRHQIFRVFSV